MAANGEIGTLQPVREIGRVARARGVPFHVDAVGAVGRLPLVVDDVARSICSPCRRTISTGRPGRARCGCGPSVRLGPDRARRRAGGRLSLGHREPAGHRRHGRGRRPRARRGRRARSRAWRRCAIGCSRAARARAAARASPARAGPATPAAPRQRGRARREGRRGPAGARPARGGRVVGLGCNLTTGEPSHVLARDRLRARGARGLALLHARPVDDRAPRWTRCWTSCPASSTACAGSRRCDVRLFLFDIDGTLVTARGAGRAASPARWPRPTASPARSTPTTSAARPTRASCRTSCAAPGSTTRASPPGSPACFAAYVARAGGAHRRRRARAGHARHRRAGRARWPRATTPCVGLLTGNIEPGARVKLAPTGLWPLFRVGAFGSDDIDRRRLPAVACERARARDRPRLRLRRGHDHRRHAARRRLRARLRRDRRSRWPPASTPPRS